MKKKVDLKKILGEPSFSSSGGYGEAIVLLAMKKACEEVLLLAAENATLLENRKSLDSNNYAIEKYEAFNCDVKISIDKKSILNTINQVK